MRKVTITLLLTLLLVMSTFGRASAVTDGELDGERHPYVGLMVAQDEEGNPLWRCSGTLIAPTIFLTAGHCAENPAEHVEIWFDSDVESAIPENGYPYTGDVGGTPYTHPQYDPDAYYLHDLSVVILDESIDLDEYGALPELNQLDSLQTQADEQEMTFTAVGYGLQESFPDPASWKENNQRVRMLAHPHLLPSDGTLVGDYSLLLSNNEHAGSACFGDSGGPNFIGDSNVVGAVTSYALDGNCAGTGGVYRVDQADDLDWLATFGVVP
jgi:hypothetical protein